MRLGIDRIVSISRALEFEWRGWKKKKEVRKAKGAYQDKRVHPLEKGSGVAISQMVLVVRDYAGYVCSNRRNI